MATPKHALDELREDFHRIVYAASGAGMVEDASLVTASTSRPCPDSRRFQRGVMEDPRGRPYFVFWTTSQGDLSYRLRMVRVAAGAAVELSTPETRGCRIELLRRPMPRRGGITLLYRCPCCKATRRYLYGLALMGDRIVEDGLWRCHYCARLPFASQGRYHRQLGREIFAAFYGPSARVREPLSRRPWDPQAVSDPRLVVDRFRGALVEASPAGENWPRPEAT